MTNAPLIDGRSVWLTDMYSRQACLSHHQIVIWICFWIWDEALKTLVSALKEAKEHSDKCHSRWLIYHPSRSDWLLTTILCSWGVWSPFYNHQVQVYQHWTFFQWGNVAEKTRSCEGQADWWQPLSIKKMNHSQFCENLEIPHTSIWINQWPSQVLDGLLYRLHQMQIWYDFSELTQERSSLVLLRLFKSSSGRSILPFWRTWC